MNIFYTHRDPFICAEQHCHIHLSKMLTEYAQLLSTAHRVLDGEIYYETSSKGRKIKRWRLDDIAADYNLYKATHVNHPSNMWVRDRYEHYEWLFAMWCYMHKIYFDAKGKQHKSIVLKNFLSAPPKNIKFNGFVDPYVAIQPEDHPDIHELLNNKDIDVVEAYRIFMNRKFHNWQTRTDKKRMIPNWNHSSKPNWVL